MAEEIHAPESGEDAADALLQLFSGILQPGNTAPSAETPEKTSPSEANPASRPFDALLTGLFGATDTARQASALLRAMKPYLRDTRTLDVDRVVDALQKASAIQSALKLLGGGRHV